MPVILAKIWHKLFNHQFTRIPRWFVFGTVILGVSGVMVASYLTYEHFSPQDMTCPIVPKGCETVTASSYSEVLHLPVAVLGLAYYVLLIVLIFIYLRKKNVKLILFIVYLTSVGLIMSGWFVFAQLALLHTVCFYCMVSASITLLLFILDIVLLTKYKIKANLLPR